MTRMPGISAHLTRGTKYVVSRACHVAPREVWGEQGIGYGQLHAVSAGPR